MFEYRFSKDFEIKKSIENIFSPNIFDMSNNNNKKLFLLIESSISHII